MYLLLVCSVYFSILATKKNDLRGIIFMLSYVCLSCEFSSARVLICLKLKELNHDNIKPFVGACVEPGHICYLMQCCSRGTLQVSFKCDQAFSSSSLFTIILLW